MKVSRGVVIGTVVAGALGTASAETRPRAPINVVAPAPVANSGLEPDDLPPPQAETVARTSTIDMPSVPDFQLTSQEPGFHTPRALQVHGQTALGREVKVKGYVVWIYDCAQALSAANPGVPRPQLLQAMGANPSLCEEPKIYLGDRKDTPRGAAIWVVDMPRAPTAQERLTMARSELKAWREPPRLAMGDYVVVSGTWAVRSPHAEHNSNGLLVYKAVEQAPPPPAVVEPPPPPPSLPPIEVTTTVPLRKAVDPGVRDASIEQLNRCNRALAARRYAEALAACDAAIQAWDDNHLAWYARASVHLVKSDWKAALASIERAVVLRPDFAMYQMYHGMALFETGARDAARDALRRAVRIAPDLWRAHYYLGRYFRDRGDARLAAEQFTQTVKAHPGYRYGYVALGELYRKWGYVDEALIVATLGTRNVAATESADLWLQAGTSYDAKAADDKAIVAFGRAIEVRPSDAYAKLQRGRLYFRKGELVNARRDLEDVVKSADPAMADGKQLATQLLAQLTGAASQESARKTSCTASNLCQVYVPPRMSWMHAEPWRCP